MDATIQAKSWYEASYTYQFGGPNDSDPFWHFAEKDKWKFGWSKPEALYAFTDGLADVIAAGRQTLLETATKDDPTKASASDPLVWLLAKTGANHGGEVVRGPTSIMLNNACRSESIQRFQVASTYVGSYMTVDLFGLKIGEPRWFFHNHGDFDRVVSNLLAAFPQIFGTLSVEKSGSSNKFGFTPKSVDEIAHAKELLAAFRLVETFTILKYERTSVENTDGTHSQTLNVRLHIESELCDYRRGRACWSLPIPGKRTSNHSEPKAEAIDTPLVVVRSPRVVDSLEKLSTVWQDRFLSTVLITAPPGSGKEQYAASIPFGNGREGKECPFNSLALASGDKAELERQLFGSKRDDGSVAPGLVARSTGGTLFLDEVHQPDDKDGIRASLLRTLENDSYFPVGSSEEAKVDKVLFVLATSRRMNPEGRGSSGKPLSEVPPTDFWTRMAHVLELPHPFEDVRGSELNESVECFFKHFWWERVSKVFGVTPFVCTGRETTAKTLQREQAEDLVNADKLDRAGSAFREILLSEFSSGRHKIGHRDATAEDLSIRGIRSMVSNLVSMSAGAVLGGQDWLPADADGIAHFKALAKKVVEGVLPVALIKPKESKGATPVDTIPKAVSTRKPKTSRKKR